jgi:hypothetical protein
MFEILVAGAIGAVAGGLAWVIARRSGPAGSQRHRVVLLVSFVALFTLGNAALMPHARSWKQERDVEALLTSEPLFAAVLADEPSLREPLRVGLLKALQSGQGDEALLVGQRLLSPRLWRYVPRASDAAALRLGRALTATLTDLRARDPEQCYRFLFPAVAGPPRGGTAARDDQLLAALRAVVVSARDGSAEPLDRRAAAKQLDAAFGRLRERHGADVDALKNPQAPGADRARVCAMTIALYSELVALSPAAAGQVLRHTLGPEAPTALAASPPSPAR